MLAPVEFVPDVSFADFPDLTDFPDNQYETEIDLETQTCFEQQEEEQEEEQMITDEQTPNESSENEILFGNLLSDVDNESVETSDFSEMDIRLIEFLGICFKHGISEAAGSDFLKYIKTHFEPEFPMCFKTLIRRYANTFMDFDYYAYCQNNNCNAVVNIKRSDSLKTATCLDCINLNQPTPTVSFKELAYVCSFSIKRQIQAIAEVVTLPNVQVDKNAEFNVDLVLTLDGVPLSNSGSQQLYPLQIYIENFKSRKMMNNFVIVKTVSIWDSDNPTDVDLLMIPLLIEMLELQSGFKTAWSNRTKLSIKIFIADAPCRAKVLKVLQFNGKYPCHRCYIVQTRGQLYPLPVSSEVQVKTTEHVKHLYQQMLDDNSIINNKGRLKKIN